MRFRVTLTTFAALLAAVLASQAVAAPGPVHVATIAYRLPSVPALRSLHTPRGYLVARQRTALDVHQRPGGRVLGRLSARTEFGSPRVLSVARVRGNWLGVVSAARPNGELGWVRRDARTLRLGRVPTALRADLSTRTVELRRGGRTIERVRVGVGQPGSPTPTGRFAVTDRLNGGRFSSSYGCCILALSGYQTKIPPGWTGGNRLAIHGTNSPSAVGSASSAGCLRAADADLASLMRRVPLGTPVFVRT